MKDLIPDYGEFPGQGGDENFSFVQERCVLGRFLALPPSQHTKLKRCMRYFCEVTVSHQESQIRTFIKTLMTEGTTSSVLRDCEEATMGQGTAPLLFFWGGAKQYMAQIIGCLLIIQFNSNERSQLKNIEQNLSNKNI